MKYVVIETEKMRDSRERMGRRRRMQAERDTAREKEREREREINWEGRGGGRYHDIEIEKTGQRESRE